MICLSCGLYGRHTADCPGSKRADEWDHRLVSELDHWLRQERTAEQQIGRLVRELRREGCPWSVIGMALGISRQAAQQRFGPLLRD